MKINSTIESIIAHLSSCPHTQADLRQEAELFLLQSELGNTDSFYAQGVRFHLQHVLSKGRSVDSPKRNGFNIANESSQATDPFDIDSVEGRCANIAEETHVLDIIETLCKNLSPRTKSIFLLLVDGHSVTEVAKTIGVTHAAVCHHRKEIQRVYIRVTSADQ